LTFVEPTGALARTTQTISCTVTDFDTGAPLANYPVQFFDSDLGFQIGSDTTDVNGNASITYDYTGHPVGLDTISCTYASQPSTFYIAQSPTSRSSVVTFTGNLTANISAPVTSQIVYRGETIDMNATVLDEDGATPLDGSGSPAALNDNWYDETPVIIATGSQTTWSVSPSALLGPETITFNVTENFYTSAQDTVDIIIYSYADVALTAPTQTLFGSSGSIPLTCEVTDNVASTVIPSYPVSIQQNGSTIASGVTDGSGEFSSSVLLSSLTEGNYNYTCIIADNATLYYTADTVTDSIVVEVDKSGPAISYQANTDVSGNYGRPWIFVNVSAVDSNLDEVLLNWSGVLESTTLQNGFYIVNKSSLTQGVYTFSVFANDTNGNTNVTPERTVTIDLFSPVVSIQEPVTTSYTNLSTVDLRFTATDFTRDACWYRLNGGSNISLPACANTSIAGLSLGLNNVTVYVNDSVGNIASATTLFTRDIQAPSLTVQSPTDSVEYQQVNVDVNYTVADNGIVDTCYYILNAGAPTTLPACANITLNGLANQNYNLSIFVNDTAGNLNFTLVQFEVNFTELATTPIYPLDGNVVTTTSFFVNASTNLQATTCDYVLDGGIPTSMSSSNNLSWSASVGPLSQGPHNVSFSCDDGLNTSTTFLQNFTVDSLGPVITFVAPTPDNNTARDANWTFVNVTLDESASSAVLEWTNATGSFNFSMAGSGTNWFYNRTDQADNTYTYRVFATDIYGNLNVTETRTVIISQGAPVIFIVDPVQDTTYTSTVQPLNVFASKAITEWWFELNGENFTQLQPNITFAAAFDENVLTVYGRDIAGNIGLSQVNFTINESNWFDDFGSYTGLNQSSYLRVGSNASTQFCWPLFFNDTTPQQNPASCWPYRRALNLSTSSSLTNYEVKLDLDLSSLQGAGQVQADCDDLRFSHAASYGADDTVANYWIESCEAGNATVYVRVPSVTASSVIYMYYGNNLTTTTANAQNTFTIFDEFAVAPSTSDWGSNANNWDSNGIDGYPTVAGASSQLVGQTNFPGAIHVTELWIRGNSTSGAAGYYDVGNSAGSRYLRLFIDPDNNRINLFNGANNYHTIDISTQQKITLITDFTNNNYTLYINNSQTPAITLTSASAASRQAPRLYSYYAQGLYVDRFIVRKFSTDNPTPSSLGAAQTPVVNASMRTELLEPTPRGVWDTFTAATNIPAGTNVTFNIFDESDVDQCGVLTASQLASGYSVCGSASNKSIYLAANFTADTTLVSASVFNWSINWSFGGQADVEVLNITFANTTIAGTDTIISVNVTNNEVIDASNTITQLNITYTNGTQVASLNSSPITIFGASSQIINFTWSAQSGTYLFTAIADSTNIAAESNEANNNLTVRNTVSSYQLFYGTNAFTVTLNDNSDTPLKNWSTTADEGIFYYADADSSYFPFNLAPLDASANDFEEADTALGLTDFDDSTHNLYDSDDNDVADATVSRTIGGNTLNNIPVVNSTNTSAFLTGILYDTADGMGYDGSQDIVFVTWTNTSQVGAYGTYDFEIIVPANLKQLFGVTDSVTQLFEQQ
jgi:hypothetical protein